MQIKEEKRPKSAGKMHQIYDVSKMQFWRKMTTLLKVTGTLLPLREIPVADPHNFTLSKRSVSPRVILRAGDSPCIQSSIEDSWEKMRKSWLAGELGNSSREKTCRRWPLKQYLVYSTYYIALFFSDDSRGDYTGNEWWWLVSQESMENVP